jgi:hypothetical protein|tara:strand:- start:39 stop:266 length:228 start_codon:yes stop_codon:yes gene_type:complete
MAKQPGQYGQDAIWGGPSEPRNLAPGNNFGPKGMQVLKAPAEYSPGPISSKAKVNQGGDLGALRNYGKYNNPTAK